MNMEFSRHIKMLSVAFILAAFPGCSWFSTGDSSGAADNSRSPKNVFSFTNEADFQKTLSDYKAVLVDFYGPWCGPCKRVMPIVEELAKEYADKGFAVVKVNIDNAKDFASKNSVRGVPTFIYYKDKNNVYRHTGAIDKEAFKANFKTHFGF